jgi:hypothetical protein
MLSALVAPEPSAASALSDTLVAELLAIAW